MVDWELIGVGVKQGDGTFVFEDEKASRFSTRFYKILNP